MRFIESNFRNLKKYTYGAVKSQRCEKKDVETNMGKNELVYFTSHVPRVAVRPEKQQQSDVQLSERPASLGIKEPTSHGSPHLQTQIQDGSRPIFP